MTATLDEAAVSVITRKRGRLVAIISCHLGLEWLVGVRIIYRPPHIGEMMMMMMMVMVMVMVMVMGEV